jgi:hypothetical protein
LHRLPDVILERGSAQAIEAIRLDLEMVESAARERGQGTVPMLEAQA